MPGHTAVDTASVARRDSDEERWWWILAHRSGSLGGRAHHGEDRGGSRLRLTARRWPGLLALAAAYLLYEVSRWIFAGILQVAREHAREVVSFERSLHLAVEGSVQRALDWGVANWLSRPRESRSVLWRLRVER
jgi:hypothetical protein